MYFCMYEHMRNMFCKYSCIICWKEPSRPKIKDILLYIILCYPFSLSSPVEVATTWIPKWSVEALSPHFLNCFPLVDKNYTLIPNSPTRVTDCYPNHDIQKHLLNRNTLFITHFIQINTTPQDRIDFTSSREFGPLDFYIGGSENYCIPLYLKIFIKIKFDILMCSWYGSNIICNAERLKKKVIYM